MSYCTYFEGGVIIDLKEPHLSTLKEYLSDQFENKNINIVVDENHLKVNDEWKDNGLMKHIIEFIEKNGELKSGSILCSGEDRNDIWEILIKDNKPTIREHKTITYLLRAESEARFQQSK